jgi:hypothetical protein
MKLLGKGKAKAPQPPKGGAFDLYSMKNKKSGSFEPDFLYYYSSPLGVGGS